MYLELGKARLCALVVLTTLVGYMVAGPAVEPMVLGWTLVGTALAALGANALNQWLEAERDGRMQRTQKRPLPSRRLASGPALVFGLAAAAGGPWLLGLIVDAAAGLLALATIVLYVFLYTPLKPRTPLNTLVGAVVGALPPLIGWVAARGWVDAGGWLLAGILFVWQIPHFLALAWMCRQDYARGGFRMLPAIDPNGHLTGCLAVIYTLLLLPLTLMLVWMGHCGWYYGVGALLVGAGMLAAGVAFERNPSPIAARRLFRATVIYLSLLMVLMVADRRDGQPRLASATEPTPPALREANLD